MSVFEVSRIYMCFRVLVYMCGRVCLFVCICVCVCVCFCVWLCVSRSLCVRVCEFMGVLRVFMCIFLYL